MFVPVPPPEDKYTPEFKKPDAQAPSPSPGPTDEGEYDDDSEAPRYPQRSYSRALAEEQARLMSHLAVSLTAFGMLGILGGGVLCVAGLDVVWGGRLRSDAVDVARILQGFFVLTIGAMTVLAGGQFRAAAASGDPTGRPLSAALRTLNMIYMIQIILIGLAVLVAVVMVLAMMLNPPRAW
jgi:hypothetical protein